MPTIDLRKGLNAISDVVNNRPQPLREFDQIFMKAADMLLQTEIVGRWFDGRQMVFIGDGDAIGLCLVHLHNTKILPHGPEKVHVLDFDERVVFSVRRFAERFGIADRVTAELYNVADPLPTKYMEAFEGFYTNPPFGASNAGKSIEAFLIRGFEAVSDGAIGCIVIADDKSFPWTQDVLFTTQEFVIKNDYVISELVPEFHQYHLDDAPGLTSCSMVISRAKYTSQKIDSQPLTKETLAHFYGQENPLRYRYVRDKTNGGKMSSRDHELEAI